MHATTAPLSRRQLLGGAAAVIAVGLVGSTSVCAQNGRAQNGRGGEAPTFPYRLSDTEWRRRLTPMQYYVLRQEGTERPFSNALNNEHRVGRFACAGCALPLFASATKYDSGTGWPSFYAPLPRSTGISSDGLLGYSRTAVHCARCGGHLGHVFDDGPRPTGKRYCMNGAALSFTPA